MPALEERVAGLERALEDAVEAQGDERVLRLYALARDGKRAHKELVRAGADERLLKRAFKVQGEAAVLLAAYEPGEDESAFQRVHADLFELAERAVRVKLDEEVRDSRAAELRGRLRGLEEYAGAVLRQLELLRAAADGVVEESAAAQQPDAALHRRAELLRDELAAVAGAVDALEIEPARDSETVGNARERLATAMDLNLLPRGEDDERSSEDTRNDAGARAALEPGGA